MRVRISRGGAVSYFKLKCFRCLHEWWQRDPTVTPKKCPACASPTWNQRAPKRGRPKKKK